MMTFYHCSNNKMIELDRREFIDRTKALSEEQQHIAASLIPTDTLQTALQRRDEFCTDILRALVTEITKLPNEPTIQEKEACIKECREILRIEDRRLS